MGDINFLVALACEAKPIIKHFKLQRVYDCDVFPMYVGNNIKLLVTGVGQINMASACGWLAANAAGLKQSSAYNIWLNVGTAGHGSLSVGEVFVVNRVSASCNSTYYPPLIVKWKGVYSSLKTVDQPTQQYLDKFAFDMEAYAFYKAAQQFASAELVQSFKVVSDNPQSGIEKLNAKKLTRLIESSLPEIENYVQSLLGLAQSIPEVEINDEANHILNQFHFTETQKHQFKNLWRRWQVLQRNTKQLEIDISACSNTKQLMKLLSEKLLVAPKA